jgi:anti-sigma factor RsiW
LVASAKVLVGDDKKAAHPVVSVTAEIIAKKREAPRLVRRQRELDRLPRNQIRANVEVVKPWFQGKVDFAPVVRDLSDRGFILLGGRVDQVGGRQAAALVYRIRSHVINLFVWPSNTGSEPIADLRTRGFSVSTWTEEGLRYSAVSDVDPRDLHCFATLVRGQ